MYVLNIHNIPKIFWGAWPLIMFERPKCSKVWVPFSKLSVSKNVWFTNAILGPLDFIHSEMLKRGMGGGQACLENSQWRLLFQGLDPPLGATKGYLIVAAQKPPVGFNHRFFWGLEMILIIPKIEERIDNWRECWWLVPGWYYIYIYIYFYWGVLQSMNGGCRS